MRHHSLMSRDCSCFYIDQNHVWWLSKTNLSGSTSWFPAMSTSLLEQAKTFPELWWNLLPGKHLWFASFLNSSFKCDITRVIEIRQHYRCTDNSLLQRAEGNMLTIYGAVFNLKGITLNCKIFFPDWRHELHPGMTWNVPVSVLQVQVYGPHLSLKCIADTFHYSYLELSLFVNANLKRLESFFSLLFLYWRKNIHKNRSLGWFFHTFVRHLYNGSGLGFFISQRRSNDFSKTMPNHLLAFQRNIC